MTKHTRKRQLKKIYQIHWDRYLKIIKVGDTFDNGMVKEIYHDPKAMEYGIVTLPYNGIMPVTYTYYTGGCYAFERKKDALLELGKRLDDYYKQWQHGINRVKNLQESRMNKEKRDNYDYQEYLKLKEKKIDG